MSARYDLDKFLPLDITNLALDYHVQVVESNLFFQGCTSGWLVGSMGESNEGSFFNTFKFDPTDKELYLIESNSKDIAIHYDREVPGEVETRSCFIYENETQDNMKNKILNEKTFIEALIQLSSNERHYVLLYAFYVDYGHKCKPSIEYWKLFLQIDEVFVIMESHQVYNAGPHESYVSFLCSRDFVELKRIFDARINLFNSCMQQQRNSITLQMFPLFEEFVSRP